MRKWLKNIAEIKIRLGTGSSLLNWLKNLILMTAGVKYLIDLPIIATIIVGILGIIIIYLIGWLALDIYKYPQIEAELSTEKYNPYFKKLKKRFK